MTTPFQANYAFGLGVRTESGRTVIEHSGTIQGFNTMLAYHPEDQLVVVVLANISGSASQEIATHLGILARGVGFLGGLALGWALLLGVDRGVLP